MERFLSHIHLTAEYWLKSLVLGALYLGFQLFNLSTILIILSVKLFQLLLQLLYCSIEITVFLVAII